MPKTHNNDTHIVSNQIRHFGVSEQCLNLCFIFEISLSKLAIVPGNFMLCHPLCLQNSGLDIQNLFPTIINNFLFSIVVQKYEIKKPMTHKNVESDNHD